MGDSVKGRLVVDAGAACALVEHGSSLLSVGIRRVEEPFEAGDVVDVLDESGYVIARGLARCDAHAAREEAGTVIHRDEMVVFE